MVSGELKYGHSWGSLVPSVGPCFQAVRGKCSSFLSNDLGMRPQLTNPPSMQSKIFMSEKTTLASLTCFQNAVEHLCL